MQFIFSIEKDFFISFFHILKHTVLSQELC